MITALGPVKISGGESGFSESTCLGKATPSRHPGLRLAEGGKLLGRETGPGSPQAWGTNVVAAVIPTSGWASTLGTMMARGSLLKGADAGPDSAKDPDIGSTTAPQALTPDPELPPELPSPPRASATYPDSKSAGVGRARAHLPHPGLPQWR